MERVNGYILGVSQLNEYVNNLLRRDGLLQGLQVRGEISGFKRHSSGHLYFSLKDEAALVRCVMFRQHALSLHPLPKDGEMVTVTGSISLYVKDGQYQLYVTKLQREGQGDLYAQFLASKAALEAEGLFDSAHKKPIPRLPRCVGVVTSPTGAAIQDIFQITRRRFPGMGLLLYPVKVQGEGAADQIAKAIQWMDAHKAADVLIVGRGGGSLDDLWAFNEECVARAIYACSIPIVSAVGHETDVSIADFVADLRAPTPSAAAELCVPEYDRLMGDIEGTEQALSRFCRERVERLQKELEALGQSAAFTRPSHTLALLEKEIGQQAVTMEHGLRQALLGAQAGVDACKARLDELDPRRVLGRGYAMVQVGDGYAGSIKGLQPGMEARLILRDGRADITIEQVEEHKAYGGR